MSGDGSIREPSRSTEGAGEPRVEGADGLEGAQPAPRYRLPSRAPTDTAADDLARWEALTAGSTARSTLTATTWRNGLAGFITLLTSVLILKGADIAGVASPWKFAVIALLALGAVCAIAGLWSALRAEAPPAADVDYSAARSKHGSIAAYEQSINRDSARSLAQARRRVFVALALLLTGTVLWWVSPPAKNAATNLRVTWVQNGKAATSCGEVDAAPSGTLELDVAGADSLTVISFADVRQIAVVASC